MYQKLNESRKEGKYVDFTIYAEGKHFPVHRVVLDAESEYFKLLLSADMREKREQSCEQKEVTALGVERALDFMYVEELVLDNATVAEVLKVCHLWQLSTAVKQCESFLIENLDVDNCVSSRHLASFYDLQQLADQCTNFILSHLEEMKTKLELDDLLILFEASATKDICAEKLWNFFSDWDQLRAEAGVESALCNCNLIKAFPVEKFKISKFHDVWKGTHITNCESCRDHTGKIFVRAVNSQHIEVRNCLFVKHLAKLFAEASVEELVDNFIVLNHRSVLTMPGFLDVMQDDLLKYVTSISDECSVDEFSAIVNWIRRARVREKVFPTLFDDTSVKCDKLFLSNVRSLKTIFHDLIHENVWLLKSDNCLFLRQLAEKYQLTEVQNTIDLYISEFLSSVSKQSEFLELALSSITKYIKNDLVEYQTLWDTVMLWMNHDLDARKHDFLALLKSLPIEKFPFSYLKDTVLKCGFFTEYDVCLMEGILIRTIKAEQCNAKFKKKTEQCNAEFKRMTEQREKKFTRKIEQCNAELQKKTEQMERKLTRKTNEITNLKAALSRRNWEISRLKQTISEYE